MVICELIGVTHGDMRVNGSDTWCSLSVPYERVLGAAELLSGRLRVSGISWLSDQLIAYVNKTHCIFSDILHILSMQSAPWSLFYTQDHS